MLRWVRWTMTGHVCRARRPARANLTWSTRCKTWRNRARCGSRTLRPTVVRSSTATSLHGTGCHCVPRDPTEVRGRWLSRPRHIICGMSWGNSRLSNRPFGLAGPSRRRSCTGSRTSAPRRCNTWSRAEHPKSGPSSPGTLATSPTLACCARTWRAWSTALLLLC